MQGRQAGKVDTITENVSVTSCSLISIVFTKSLNHWGKSSLVSDSCLMYHTFITSQIVERLLRYKNFEFATQF